MKRIPIPETQAALALDTDPLSEPNLRDAFVRCGLAKYGYTYEEWIADPLHKNLLGNINLARLKDRARAPRSRT